MDRHGIDTRMGLLHMAKALTVLTLMTAPAIASAQDMPSLNVKAYCIEQGAMQQGPVSPEFLLNCVTNEVDAADDLGSIWTAIPAEVRGACMPRQPQIGEQIPDGTGPQQRPGYADMRACIERQMGM